MESNDARNDINGLGGWLIVLGINIVSAPVRMLYEVVPVFKPIFENNTWEMLSSSGLSQVLIFEFFWNALYFVLSVYIIYLFFSRHYLFRNITIFFILLPLVLVPLDGWIVAQLLPQDTNFDPVNNGEYFRALVFSCIWVPYLLNSKRVRNTFVHKPASSNNSPDSSVENSVENSNENSV